MRSYLDYPSTIERLWTEAPSISRLVLNEFQASSFPILADGFRKVMELLDEELGDLPPLVEPLWITPVTLADIEEK